MTIEIKELKKDLIKYKKDLKELKVDKKEIEQLIIDISILEDQAKMMLECEIENKK